MNEEKDKKYRFYYCDYADKNYRFYYADYVDKNFIHKNKIKELIDKRNALVGYTSLECIEDIEKLLNE